MIDEAETVSVLRGQCKDGFGGRTMTNYENIKSMDVLDLGLFLCNLMNADCCQERCPAKDFCSTGHNGMKYWLEQEADLKE